MKVDRVNLVVSVPKKVRKLFAAKTKAQGTSMTFVISEFIDKYMKGAG